MTDTYDRLHQQITDRGPWQQTASGHEFFLLTPNHEDIDVEDVATSLSNQCRYNGHVRKFYSVAQHAALMSLWIDEDGYGPEYAFAALHHDSAEAYTGDIIAQVKWAIPEFKEMEEKVETAVRFAFDVRWSEDIQNVVKEYDLIALATEVRDVLNANKTDNNWGDLPQPRFDEIRPLGPSSARKFFLAQHNTLNEWRNDR